MGDEPFDALDAAVIDLARIYDAAAMAEMPIAPLRDDEPAPLWPLPVEV